MNVPSTARGTQGAIGIAELATAAAIGLTTLTMCSLMAGCSLTHVEARPAPSFSTVAVLGIRSGFQMSSEEQAQLSTSLTSSLGARGHMNASAGDAKCHVVATVQREYHSTSVAGSMRSSTDYEYGTYRVKLVVLDLDGKQLGEVRTARDVFISDMENHPEREEKILAESIRRAADALFEAPAHADTHMMSASR